METKPVYLTELLYKIFTLLSNILSFFLDNLMGSNCTIFILVAITLLGFVLFSASTSAEIDNILDTDADLERRKNDSRLPLDLAYVTNGVSSPFLIDRNDSTGLRMRALFINRASLTLKDGRSGFTTNPRHAVYNNQGELLVNAPLVTFVAVHTFRGVQTLGRPIQVQAHPVDFNTRVILRVSRHV